MDSSWMLFWKEESLDLYETSLTARFVIDGYWWWYLCDSFQIVRHRTHTHTRKAPLQRIPHPGSTARKSWTDWGSEPSTDAGRSAGTRHSKTSREGLLVLSSRWGDWFPKTAKVVVMFSVKSSEKLGSCHGKRRPRMLPDDVCVTGEGLDWQHIRNEFYTAMPESFGEVSRFVWSTVASCVQSERIVNWCQL